MQENDHGAGLVERKPGREERGGGAGGAELRTKELWVPNWNLVISMAKAPWRRFCVPSRAPAFLLKGNHQHGLLTKCTPQRILDLVEGRRLGLRSPTDSTYRLYLLTLALLAGNGSRLEIPGGSRICSLKTKRSQGVP